MSYWDLVEHLQRSQYEQLAQNLLRAVVMKDAKTMFRRADTVEASTEVLNDIGTTDAAVGDVTAEMMITTTGKIPSEMYYLEDMSTSSVAHINATTANVTHSMTEATDKLYNSGFTDHSALFLKLILALLVLLLFCCCAACFIARSRKHDTFFGRNDIECEPGCSGINQPLLRNERSDTTSKTSSASMKN